jgi:predicted nucleotidyltransferase
MYELPSALEVRIVIFFLAHAGGIFGIRELSRKMKTDYKMVHTAVQKLSKKGILIKKRQANLDLCSLNLKGDLTQAYYGELLRANDFLKAHDELASFFNSVKEKVKTIFYSLVVFGSFAKGTETMNSDLDLLIIAQSRELGEEIERIISAETVLLKTKVHAIVLTETEFTAGLKEKKINISTEALKNHIIIAGIEAFYNALGQAI